MQPSSVLAAAAAACGLAVAPIGAQEAEARDFAVARLAG